MRFTRALAALVTFPNICVAAPQASALDVALSQSSIRIGDTELRSGPSAGTGRYISLEAATRALGPSQDSYLAGLGVTVYAWPEFGIHVQRGFRGPEQGKIFKFQVWLDDYYSKAESKHSGKFIGHVHVERLDITSQTTFDSIRADLQEAGFEIIAYSHVITAKKGHISIFTVDTTNKIERVEAWCD